FAICGSAGSAAALAARRRNWRRGNFMMPLNAPGNKAYLRPGAPYKLPKRTHGLSAAELARGWAAPTPNIENNPMQSSRRPGEGYEGRGGLPIRRSGALAGNYFDSRR